MREPRIEAARRKVKAGAVLETRLRVLHSAQRAMA